MMKVSLSFPLLRPFLRLLFFAGAAACRLAGTVLAQEEPKAAETASPPEKISLILVQGAAGEAEYGAQFSKQTAAWQKAAAKTQAQVLRVIGSPDAEDSKKPQTEPETDHGRLRDALAAAPKDGPDALWIVLHGHGVWDGKEARFNLRGPDLSASELAAWLKPFQRPVTVINTASASAPFLQALAGPGRITLSATRSGSERNYTRFGGYLAEALEDAQTDLDLDGRVSLLELFLSAAHRTAAFYKTAGRIATEHALLDDNGDGLGTPAEWFRGVRAVKKPANDAAADGFLAHRTGLHAEEGAPLSPERRQEREVLERELSALRDRRETLPEAEYLQRLEALLLRLAQVYPAP